MFAYPFVNDKIALTAILLCKAQQETSSRHPSRQRQSRTEFSKE
jgi:hypothetical protein